MKRRIPHVAAMFGLLIAAGAAHSQERVVHVYNWSDYIDESILADFTRETGIRVVYDVFDNNDIVETKLLAGGSGYDLVAPTAPLLARQIQAGVFQKLDKSKLSNLGNLWPEISERLAKYDPGNEHAVNYMWGTTGIGYNVEKVKAALGDVPLDSWDLIFKPENAEKLAACGINLIDAVDETLALALNYLGKDPDSRDSADLEAAADVYRGVRPHVRSFNASSYLDELANGDICISIGWSGDVLQAKARAEEAGNGIEIEYVIPKEGTYIWLDNFAIPADAKNVAEAHEFINYLLKPEVIAKASNYVRYANGNLASKEFLEAEIRDDPGVYPDEATFEKLFTISPYGPREQRVINRLWTNIKTGS